MLDLLITGARVRTFVPGAAGRRISISPGRETCVSSTMTTASAPAGIMPPVCTNAAAPRVRVRLVSAPMGTSPARLR